MADGGAKGFMKDLGEQVVAPVRDEFQKAIEEGSTQVTGKVSDPQQTQTQNQNTQSADAKAMADKQAEDQRKAQNIKNFFTQLQNQEQRSNQEKNVEQQKKQQDEQQEQEKKQVKQFEVQQKEQQMTDLQSKQRRVEIKKGGF